MAAWALFLFAGCAALMSFVVFGLGASVPPLPNMLAEVGMGLCVRAAYKSTGGWDWADWSIAGDATSETGEADDLHGHQGATAGAMG